MCFISISVCSFKEATERLHVKAQERAAKEAAEAARCTFEPFDEVDLDVAGDYGDEEVGDEDDPNSYPGMSFLGGVQ